MFSIPGVEDEPPLRSSKQPLMKTVLLVALLSPPSAEPNEVSAAVPSTLDPDSDSDSDSDSDPDPDSDLPPVALHIDLPDRELMNDHAEHWIREDMTQAFTDEGVRVDAEASMRVEVTVHLVGEKGTVAEIDAVVWESGTDEPILRRAYRCPCDDHRISERLARSAATIAGWLTQRAEAVPAAPAESEVPLPPVDPAPPPPDPPPPPPAELVRPPPTSPVPPPPPLPRIGALGISGAAIAGGGLIAAAVGLALLVRKDQVSLASSDDRRSRTKTFRDPGIGLLSGGAGLVAVGLPLLITDLVRRRRRAQPLSWAATWNRGPGLTLNTSF